MSKEIERPVPLAPMSPFNFGVSVSSTLKPKKKKHFEECDEIEEDHYLEDDDRPRSAFGKSLAEQSDREVQQEHWHKE
jgi:hypothetical protein